MKKLLALITLITLLGANAVAFAAGWNEEIKEAIKYSNFNRVNVIAASHPEAQGAIALFLLQHSQDYKNDPQMQVKVFSAATPFVGRIPASDTAQAGEVIRALVKFASSPDFQKSYPRDAADIYLHALHMSGQPNLVAFDPNLHSEVLEAANDFVKGHPQDADKKLLEEVSLAQAGGAPETQPMGVIDPSAE